MTSSNEILTIIDKKRHGATHSDAEINTLIAGVMDGTVPDYQLSAWLMAVCINGLDLDETVALTRAFVESGVTLNFDALPELELSEPKLADSESDAIGSSESDGMNQSETKGSKTLKTVDKHSTGGVGDKTTLILVPLLAACGVRVAKLSGRGLGFTGGTIDKLEAIPGFKTALSIEEFTQQVQELGMAISSQTADLTPADGKVYALRDVTATVDSIPLITASVVSKKIATGADAIVLDIKVGQGAFVKTLDEAKQLAEWCRAVGERFGKPIATVITSMEVPLGHAVGNALEVREAIDTLQGKGPQDLLDVTLELGAVALVAADEASDVPSGRACLMAAIEEGRAYEAFLKLVAAQSVKEVSGDGNINFPEPLRVKVLPAPNTGVVSQMDCLAIAKAVKLLGGGRQHKGDPIDLSVGVVLHKKPGDAVSQGEPLLEMHSSGKKDDVAWAMLQDAVVIGDTVIPQPPLILETCLPHPGSLRRGH